MKLSKETQNEILFIFMCIEMSSKKKHLATHITSSLNRSILPKATHYNTITTDEFV